MRTGPPPAGLDAELAPGTESDPGSRTPLAVGALCGCQVLPIQPVCPHCSSATTSVRYASLATTTSGPRFQNKVSCDYLFIFLF